jgi:sterol desaturase/sphingolipid hydroxylase (fatty acid hydroxylase superfamily)
MRAIDRSLLHAFDAVAAVALPSAVGAMLLSRAVAPLRPPRLPRGPRLRLNASIALFAGAAARFLMLPGALLAARECRRRGLGLVNVLRLHGPASTAVAFVLLDATMYLWHRANHDVGWLWRAHEVHHADDDLDATTAIRFHPAELVASVPARVAQIVLVGASPASVLAYELVMDLAAIFHHSGVGLPERFDRILRTVVVTPRMHYVHHGATLEETSSNWSIVLSAWDRLFGTYRDPDAAPPATRTIGSPGPTASAPRGLLALLLLPFARAEARA